VIGRVVHRVTVGGTGQRVIGHLIEPHEHIIKRGVVSATPSPVANTRISTR
jgi:hypothetical protein